MRSVGGFSKLLAYAIALSVGLWVTAAEAKANKATIRAVRGTADVSTDKGATWKPAKINATLGGDSIVRTAAGSVVDLFLGDNGPVVRVTESTQMGIDKLDSEGTGADKVIETQLDLKNGRILGNVKKLAAASRYEVKTPVGVAGIRGTEFDISANGTVHVISGQVQVVYIVNGQPLPPVTGNQGQTIQPPAGANPNPIVIVTPPGAAIPPPVIIPGGGTPGGSPLTVVLPNQTQGTENPGAQITGDTLKDTSTTSP